MEKGQFCHLIVTDSAQMDGVETLAIFLSNVTMTVIHEYMHGEHTVNFAFSIIKYYCRYYLEPIRQ